ncbi:hypothetical protein AWJ20_2544 [Sugiyamaella lignohabitans]|uniref:Beta-mannosidase B n=1 Tax=Sugiyamaella lignohabitans TaxID=796027 RepID=A0A161HMH3_9ASCO|nr:uncharacterized protein AWJ20_2544 [Sugiyamaella lignohabitans]ANB14927.1 hypothetical protein AWJ20_2544 [Sugiyamaella lignohabitans]
MVRQAIDSGWKFKQADKPDSDYSSVSQFPTVVQLDLLAQGKIPDPFLDSNQSKVQFIGEREWIYKTVFTADDENEATSELVFDGLDTHANVYLNGEKILYAENMFVQYRVDVSKKLKKENELLIHFESTYVIGKKLEEKHGADFLCWNGVSSSRLAVRKAPYSYGWDWGPILLTVGPWKPIWLERYSSRIVDVSYATKFNSYSDVTLEITTEVEGNAGGLKYELISPNGDVVASESGPSKISFNLNDPLLWYPIGYGKQSLYTLRTSLISSGKTIDSKETKIGLREIKLVQKPLEGEEGTSFFFQINGIPIFCKGSDWIPCDSLLPRVDAKKLRNWVQLAADGNQNMIRVWGGGVYEDDAFYEACDEIGVMVWNDFQFACGAYPADKHYIDIVKDEAVYNVKRLRSHPSIVLWCGNNEDYMFAEHYKLEYDAKDSNPENWLKTNFPARYIYEVTFKEVCESLTPEVPYHFGSPWGGALSNSKEYGDTHSWEVWMADGKQLPYQEYHTISGRFVSEFGMKSYPNMKTIKEFITEEKDRYPQSRVMDDHQKAPRDQSSLALYLVDNFKHGYSMEKYVYATQLLQAEALSNAYQSWRRLWKGPGKEYCAGSLVWQLNDCWPVVSWSLADYSLRPKASFFTIKRDIADISVGIFRKSEEIKKSKYTDVDIEKKVSVEVWGSNFTLSSVPADLILTGYAVDGKKLWTKTQSNVVLHPNSSTELTVEALNDEQPCIVFARLESKGKVLARTANWPQPLKYLDLAKPDISLSVNGDEISVRADAPVKGLIFDLEHDEVKFEDNCLDLEPGVEQKIHAKGLNGRSVTYLHLGIAY